MRSRDLLYSVVSGSIYKLASFTHGESSPLFRLTSLPSRYMHKALLMDRSVGTGSVSDSMADRMRGAVREDPDLKDVNVQLGTTDISQSLKDVWGRKDTNVLSKLLRTPATVVGGLSSKLMQYDHYDPFSHTARVFSDNPAVGLHELGHAKDYKGSLGKALGYGLANTVPGNPGSLVAEARASANAVNKMKPGERHLAGRTLAPAFGTYAGAAVGGVLDALYRRRAEEGPALGVDVGKYRVALAPLVGAAAGHIGGRLYNKYRNKTEERSE